MTITIQLTDQEASALQSRALQEGLTINTFLQRMAEQQARIPALVQAGSDSRPIWEIMTELMSDVPDEVFDRLPTDGASEHDHYLYGTPKRNQ